jgi:bisphosphoglycerate-independent phosphoglycerate mutase (AlkP superfamily)
LNVVLWIFESCCRPKTHLLCCNQTNYADDAVVICNFRADRVIEISKAFEYEHFTAFDRVRWPKTRFAGLMQYDGDLKLPKNFLVPPPAINGTSGEGIKVPLSFSR